jgi:diguanylate cyclase (GGDEF)-like protein
MTLRRKMTLMGSVILVALLVANLLVVRYQYDRSLAQDLNNRMQTMGTTVGLMILPALVMSGGNLEEKLSEVRTILRKTAEAQPDISEISLYDEQMNALLVYPERRIVAMGAHEIERVVPVQLIKDGRTYGYVRVTFDLRASEEAQLDVMIRLVLIAAAFSLAGLLASFLVARTITHPIERLRDGALEFGRKNYDARVPVTTRDEIGLLSETFNEMASGIQKQIRKILQLQEWSREIAAELDRTRVIEVVVKAFAELGGVGKMSLMLMNEATGLLEIVGGTGLNPDAAGFVRLKVGEGIAGKVVETGKVMRVERMESSSEYKSFSGQEHARSGMLLALPLVAKGRCFGVVNLHDKSDGTAFDESDESVLTTLAEIAAVAFENSRLYDLAITDGLTRLFIVRYFHQRLDEEITRTRRTSHPLSLLMLDIDHFKSVNDTYGHQSGDTVLVGIARIIRKVFREVDIPCRYGGEEFAVILPNTDEAGAVIVAERFRSAVEATVFPLPQGEIHVTVSIGISTYKIGKAKEVMIQEADAALYSSKRQGRNRVSSHAANNA